jgi:RNA polymerase sigma-70 factor (ECF subfamily)
MVCCASEMDDLDAADVDRALVARVVAGAEDAILTLVDRHDAAMSCVAAAILNDASHVPDVVQEAWIRVLSGLGGFAFRSSLKTWILRVTANAARTAAARLGRTIAIGDVEEQPTVDPERFTAIGRWRDPPQPWTTGEPEAALLRKELAALVQRELEELPPAQRAVVMLRDVEELTSDEICAMLELSEANQRVLLHRGRARLRAAIERELKRR